jgi:type VI secretion system protein ImpA
MPVLDLSSLLAPLAGDAPCGADLEYDPASAALHEAAAGKPERQYDKVYPAEPADWVTVHELALALAMRSRDLRVAVWLIRSGARFEGFEAAAQGLALLHGLVERHWDHVHPQLDPSDGNDPTTRVNVIAQLVHDAVLGDLRAASLTNVRGAVTVRELELSFGHAEPLPGESVPTEVGITPAVAALQAQSPGLAQAMSGALASAQALGKLLDDRLGATHSPDLRALFKLLQCLADAGRAAQAGAPTGAPAASDAAGHRVAASAAVPAPLNAIQSREDAIRVLGRVCEWIERNEPSHPAPLLIQRARRLMQKNFIDIIRDLVPDGLGQIEKLAGPGRE